MAIDTPPRAPLRIEVPATADRLSDIRRQLTAWLEPMGLSDTMAADIVLVVNEACTNGIEHAYRDTDTGLIRVEAALDGRHIVICIADSGVWRSPPSQPSTRARGLQIMHAVSDGVELETSSAGTTVRIRFEAADAESALQEFGSRTT